jgi:hypothetical protein
MIYHQTWLLWLLSPGVVMVVTAPPEHDDKPSKTPQVASESMQPLDQPTASWLQSQSTP